MSVPESPALPAIASLVVGDGAVKGEAVKSSPLARRRKAPIRAYIGRALQRNSISLIISFAFHVLIATALFVIICCAAIGLHYLVRWMTWIGMAPFFVYIGIGLEYMLCGADAFCFVIFVARETIENVRNMWHSTKSNRETP